MLSNSGNDSGCHSRMVLGDCRHDVYWSSCDDARLLIPRNDCGRCRRYPSIFWGVRTRFIGWADVKKIVKTRAPIGVGRYSDRFQVYSKDRGIICRFFLNVCGNITFDERICRVRRLLDQINLQAQEHAIPFFVWDLQAIAKRRRVPGEKRERGRTELPLTEF